MTAWVELQYLSEVGDGSFPYSLGTVAKLRWVPFLDTCVLETVHDLTPFPCLFLNHIMVQGKVFAMPRASGSCCKLVLFTGQCQWDWNGVFMETEPLALVLDATLPAAVHVAARADALLALAQRVCSGSWESCWSGGCLYSLRYPREGGHPLTVVPFMDDHVCFWGALEAQEEWLHCEERWSRSRAAWIGAVVVGSS